MNINYHYYTIKTLAITAGFAEDEAQRIAHFSQYIDDGIFPWTIITDVKPPPFFYENNLVEDIEKDGSYKIIVCSTGINILNSISIPYQVHAITPFHFIPPKPLPELKEEVEDSSRTIYRCVQAGSKSGDDDDLFINKLINEITDKLINNTDPLKRNEYLTRLGMILHTYADTYAHCNYSGLTGYENRSHVVRAFDKAHNKEVFDRWYAILPPTGHANTGHTPDICYYELEYEMKSRKSETFTVDRDNTSHFAVCSENILKLLCKITGKEPTLKFEELQEKIAVAQTVEKEEPEYLTPSWEKAFPDTVYSYNKADYFDIKRTHAMIEGDEKAYIIDDDNAYDPYDIFDESDPITIHSREYVDDEDYEAYMSATSYKPKGCGKYRPVKVSGVNDDFYSYITAAFKRIYAVVGDFKQFNITLDNQNNIPCHQEGLMNKVTFKDIGLSAYNFDYILNLKDALINAPVEVCIERAHCITNYMTGKDCPHKNYPSMEKEPMLYRAEAVSNYLTNKKAFFFDGNMLAGTTGSKFKSAPLYPEFIGLTIWSELETITRRKKNPMLLTKAEAETLNFDIFPYWIDKDVLASSKKKHGNDHVPIQLLEKFIFYVSGKAGCISHTVPNFERVLEEGVDEIIKDTENKMAASSGETKEFYNSVITVLKGFLVYVANLADEAESLAKKEKNLKRKKDLLEMAHVCRNVPRKRPKTFREAVNAVWLCLIAIHAENMNMAISPGRLDQILYPWYRHDIDNKVITVQEAINIVGSLWIKLGDNVNLVPQVSEELFGGASSAPAVTVGGIDENGEDAVNDLTYIILRVTEVLKAREPSMNARYNHEKNSKEYRNRVCEVIGGTKAVLALHNDVANIKTLLNQGLKLKHARDYSIVGCVELSSSGKSYDASSSIILNLSAIIEMALYNGKRYITGDEQFGPTTGNPEDFKTFDDFLNAFETQLKWLIEQAVQLNEDMAKIHQKMLPTPLLSALFEGPLEKGKDLVFGGALYNSSGATHVAFADVVDSLNAIKKVVFDDKICSFTELIKIIRANFEGHADFKKYLIDSCLKYGTEEEIKEGHSKYLIKLLYDTYQSYTNYRGGKYRPAYWTMTNHSGQGKICHALPNGREANVPFASGITPSSSTMASLTECLNSVASLGYDYIPGGEALNIKFTNIKDTKDAEKMGDFIESYFMKGGQQIQFNIMSHSLLCDAKKNPDNHKDLLVRVSGYSAYFNDLNDAMKDELITRAEYNISNGEKVVNYE